MPLKSISELQQNETFNLGHKGILFPILISKNVEEIPMEYMSFL